MAAVTGAWPGLWPVWDVCLPSCLGTPLKCIMLAFNQQFIFFKIITDISHHNNFFKLIYEHSINKVSINKDACKTLNITIKVNGENEHIVKNILKTAIDKKANK